MKIMKSNFNLHKVLENIIISTIKSNNVYLQG